jgi:hypothetical protein
MLPAARSTAPRTCRVAAGRRAWRRAIAVLLGALLSSAVRAAGTEETVYVARDDTPLLAAPAEDAEVLLRPNAGHRLIILERTGAWLKVRSPQHIVVNKDMWVPADKVGPRPARAQSAPAQEPVAAPRPRPLGFHLAVNGTPGLKIRTACRIVDTERDLRRLREFTELLPAAYDLPGSAVSCSVRKLDDFGRLEAALSTRNGDLIAVAETGAPFGSVRIRSAGPWGDADASRGSSRIFLLREPPDLGVQRPPARTPVPPFTSPPVPPLSGLARPLDPAPP